MYMHTKYIEYYDKLQSLIILRLLLHLIDSVTECVRRAPRPLPVKRRHRFRP